MYIHVYTCIYMAAAATAAVAAAAAAAAVAAAAVARQKCVTVVENRTGTLFGHIFAIRKVPKVCNRRQKLSGHTFRAHVCNSKSAKSV